MNSVKQILLIPSKRTVILFAAVFSLTATFFIFYDCLSINGFTPEDPLFYVANCQLNFRQLLEKYLSTSFNWYRPTSFHTFYFFITKFISWHNVVGLRSINVFTVALSSFLIFLVGWSLEEKKAADSKIRIGLLASTFYLTSPTIVVPTLFTTAFDFLYQIFFLGSFLLYIFYVRNRTAGTGHNKKTTLFYFLSLSFFIVSLTCKELVVILPAMLLGYELLQNKNNSSSYKKFLKTELFQGVQKTAFFWLTLLIYLGCRIPTLSLNAQGNYRTLFNWWKIHHNFTSAFFWVARFYPKPEFQSETFRDPYTILFGFIILIFFVYGFSKIKSHRTYTVGSLISRTSLWVIPLLSIIPIYMGGYAWHFALPMASFGILLGFSSETLLDRFYRKKWGNFLFFSLLSLFFIIGKMNFFQYWVTIRKGLEGTALLFESPPIPKNLITSHTKILIRNSENDPAWGFANGQMFPYIYLEPNLPTLIWQDASKEQLLEWSQAPSRYCVDYDPKIATWVNKTEDCLVEVKGKTSQVSVK